MEKEEIIAENTKLLKEFHDNNDLMRKQRDVDYAIRGKIAINKKRLIKFSTIQIGDKVLAKGVKHIGGWSDAKWIDVEGFVSNIKNRIDKDGAVKYFYDVNAIKKDGGMSLRLIDSYHSKAMEAESIELIK